MSSRLAFRRISIVSPSRHYEVHLHDGMNVVTGPISTGKSSVLEIMNYACGAKTPLRYPEISKCSDIMVEMIVGTDLLTLQRSLKKSGAHSFLYYGTIDDITAGKQPESLEILSAPSPKSPLSSISSEFLNRLGIGAVEVKSAPTQDASDTNAFSIRDLFSLIYVSQSRMARSPGFFEDDFAKAIKWKAAFEIVHGLYNEQETLISKALKDCLKEEERLKSSLQAAQEFLGQLNIPDLEKAEQQIRELTVSEERLTQRILEHKSAEVERLGEHFELLNKREAIFAATKRTAASESELDKSLSQLGRLQVQYERELRQLEFLLESDSLLSKTPITKCPACFQAIAINEHDLDDCYVCHQSLPQQERVAGIDRQIKAIRLRIADLEKYVQELTAEKGARTKSKAGLLKTLTETDKSIERVRETANFPSDQALLQMSEERSRIQNEIRRLNDYIAYRRRALGEGSNLTALQDRTRSLREQLDQLKANRPKAQNVIGELSASFATFLERFRFPYSTKNARLDEQHYLPIVRDQLYTEIRSNGAIALIQCAWHLALLQYSLDHDQSQFPRCLFLDSPLNHVGKAATDPDFRDQKIVDEFYRLMKELHDKHKNKFQIFICDNQPGSQFGTLLTEEFTGKVGEGRYGLIDDEHP